MEDEFGYSPLDLAIVISSLDLGVRETADFLEFVWCEEQPYLADEWRKDKRQLILQVFHWLTYLQNQPVIDTELPLIQREITEMGREFQFSCSFDREALLNLFFKSARLRLRYGDITHVRIKRRTLLARYGYKRMSATLLERINRCLQVYRLQPFLRDRVPCRLENTSIDDMIILRLLPADSAHKTE